MKNFYPHDFQMYLYPGILYYNLMHFFFNIIIWSSYNTTVINVFPTVFEKKIEELRTNLAVCTLVDFYF